MMNKTLRQFATRLCTMVFLASGWCIWAGQHRIAVIVPMEHQAMDDIVQGIQDNLPAKDYKISVHRAHGDLNILANVLNQITYQKIDAVIAIGTTTSQMALSGLPSDMIVICAATSIMPDRENVYTIDDSADMSGLIKKLPHLNHLGVCYSAQDKSIAEVTELKVALKETNIIVEERMAHTIQDLPTAVHSFSSKVQAILLFKDHLTVSGLPIFISECASRKIPLIASDESSVRKGATIAFGVQEQQIGVLSAQVLKNHFEGHEQPIVISLTPFAKLYLNKNTFKQQELWSMDEMLNMGWTIVEVD